MTQNVLTFIPFWATTLFTFSAKLFHVKQTLPLEPRSNASHRLNQATLLHLLATLVIFGGDTRHKRGQLGSISSIPKFSLQHQGREYFLCWTGYYYAVNLKLSKANWYSMKMEPTKKKQSRKVGSKDIFWVLNQSMSVIHINHHFFFFLPIW